MLFEPLLVPYAHYVPLWDEPADADGHGVVRRLAWLEAEPDIAQRIAHAGRRFACDVLGPRGRQAMWRSLLQRYSALVRRRGGPAVDNAFVARRLQLHGHLLGDGQQWQHQQEVRLLAQKWRVGSASGRPRMGRRH